MKALSVKQPFAELIVSGTKTIEIRSWKTNFRGQLLIHASKTPDKTAMARHGYDDLPRGVIVGKVELVDVKEYGDETEFKEDRKRHLASSDYGHFGFLLKHPKRLAPVEAKGKLGFWECDYQE